MKRIIVVALAVIGMLFLSGGVQAGLNDGLVAYYPFNGNANDESGNGNDGVVNGATLIADKDGNANSAYSFDGTNDTITVVDDGTFNVVNALTIAVWIKIPDPIISNYMSFISKSSCQSNTGYVFPYYYNDSFGLITHTGTWKFDNTYNFSNINNPENWHFYVGVFDGNSRLFYIDGVLVSSNSQSGVITSNSNNLVIGNQPGCNEWADAVMDDVRIYNRALSDSEIQQLYTTSPQSSSQTWYLDYDSDGYGNPNYPLDSESQLSGYVLDNTDCDDNDSNSYPGATEIAGDGVDQDCDGSDFQTSNTETIIESDSSWLVSTQFIDGWYDINFDDSSWVNAASPANGCGYNSHLWQKGTFEVTDMWSSNASYGVYLRKTFLLENKTITSAILSSWCDDDYELYVNGTLLISEMNGSAGPDDEIDIKNYLLPGKTNVIAVYGQDTAGGCQYVFLHSRIEYGNAVASSTWYLDYDQDGYGDINYPMDMTTQPTGYVSDKTDCDDTDSTINPGATEIAGDNIDQDCDGSDAASTTTPTNKQIYAIAPANNETLSFGSTNGQLTFSFTKITDATKYLLHFELNDIINYTTIPISSELIPSGSGKAATPGFSETFVGMTYNIPLDSPTWDSMALYNIKWGVEAFNSSGVLIGSTYASSVPNKYVSDIKFLASTAIALTSPSPGSTLVLSDSPPVFKWDLYSGVSAYELILARVDGASFSPVLPFPNLTLNLLTMDDPTWQAMPTGTWYWTVLGKDSIGNQMPPKFTIFDFEVQ